MGVNGQRHALAALYPRERIPGIHWIGGWVGLRAGLDTEVRRKILCLCRGWGNGPVFFRRNNIKVIPGIGPTYYLCCYAVEKNLVSDTERRA
jgi:hypothetical protein